MSDIAIHVENLGKSYRIVANKGHGRYRTLRDDLLALPKTLWATLRGRQEKYETVWALQDVSFDVRVGEVIGVIGRNGAGKSTLLKLLSRITEPTNGRAEIYGRVGSLLEVGTGFHPELTGRENIFLSGAVLGMTRQEVQTKFDEIVEFAEVERFVDDPVKHYSSGMYMRLAFGVAAHLEPEVLVVDEVLAVGDASFQKKCLGKMGEVAKTGRTVLFVSHSMPAIQSLCQKGLLLANGQVNFFGSVDQAVEKYMKSDDIETGIVDLTNCNRFGSGEMKLLRFWVEDETGTPVASIPSGSCCYLTVEYMCMDDKPRRDVSMSIHIYSSIGTFLSLINTQMLNQHFDFAPPRGYIRFKIPNLPLNTGRYIVDLHIATYAGHTTADYLRNAAAFDVSEGDFYRTGRSTNLGFPMIIQGSWYLEEILSGNIN